MKEPVFCLHRSAYIKNGRLYRAWRESLGQTAGDLLHIRSVCASVRCSIYRPKIASESRTHTEDCCIPQLVRLTNAVRHFCYVRRLQSASILRFDTEFFRSRTVHQKRLILERKNRKFARRPRRTWKKRRKESYRMAN